MGQKSFNEFKNQLWTCIQSCPVIYINHFHSQYVDKALSELLADNEISADTIVEYDSGRGSIVHFETKRIDNDFKRIRSIKELLCELIDNNLKDELSENSNPNHLILFKGLGYKAFWENEYISSLMQIFATKYESGEYDNETTIIIVSPEPLETLPLTIRKFFTVLEIAPPTTEEIYDYIKKNNWRNNQ